MSAGKAITCESIDILGYFFNVGNNVNKVCKEWKIWKIIWKILLYYWIFDELETITKNTNDEYAQLYFRSSSGIVIEKKIGSAVLKLLRTTENGGTTGPVRLSYIFDYDRNFVRVEQ